MWRCLFVRVMCLFGLFHLLVLFLYATGLVLNASATFSNGLCTIARTSLSKTTFRLLCQCAIHRCVCGNTIAVRFGNAFQCNGHFLNAIRCSFYINEVTKACLCTIQYNGNDFSFGLINAIFFRALQECMFRYNVRQGVLRNTSYRFRQRTFIRATRFHFIGITTRGRVIRINGNDSNNSIVRDIARSGQIASFSKCVRGRANGNKASRNAARENTILNSTFLCGFRIVFYYLRFLTYLLRTCFPFFMLFDTSGLIIMRFLNANRVHFNLNDISFHRSCTTFNEIRLSRFKCRLCFNGRFPLLRALSYFLMCFNGSAKGLQLSGSFVSQFRFTNNCNDLFGIYRFQGCHFMCYCFELKLLMRGGRYPGRWNDGCCRWYSFRGLLYFRLVFAVWLFAVSVTVVS